ncbi:MAG: MFS transporter [Firmicutes bacterium]|nr:MFS transporter [Bacillota bacterium]
MEDQAPYPRLWKNRNYITLFIGQMLSSLGSNVYSFALLWDMKVMTNNTFLMSLVGIGWMLPQVILGPFAGVFVDRWNKRWTMFWSDAIRLILTAVVTALAFSHDLTPVVMILSAFLLNAVGTLFGPASGALTPLLVGKEQLASANGLEQAAGPLSMMLGPAIAAGLIAWQGVPMAYAINALSFLISVATLFVIRVGEPPLVRQSFAPAVFFGEMREGLQTVRRIRLLMVLFPVAFLLNFLLAPFDLYMVQFVTVALHRTQVALGELNSLFAVGMMTGALTVGVVSRYVRPGYLLAGASLGFSLAFFGLACSSWLPAIVALSFCMGVCNSWINIPIVTMIQRVVPQAFLGRVFSLMGSLFGAAMPLGLLLGGFLAHDIAIRDVLVIIAVISSLLSVLLFLIPTVRRADLNAPLAASA